MSVDRIKESILAEARAEAEKIVSAAQREHDEALNERKSALDAEFSRRREEARQKIEQEANRDVMQVRMGKNFEILKKRNAVLDELFEKAAEKFTQLSDDEYRSVVENWMKDIPSDMAGEVLCNEKDEQRLAKLVEKLNSKRPDGAKLELKKHDRPLRGGVIFRSEKFEVDLTLDSRLATLRSEIAPGVAEILFDNKGEQRKD